MKTTTDIRERIRVRAYYLSLKYEAASALSCWLLAERTELQLAQGRAAAARKAAATRRAKAANKVPAEMLAVLPVHRGGARRPTAH